MKILFLEQAMNWWFGDWYPRCDLPDGIVGTRFIFLQTNKFLKNRRVFFYWCGNGSAAPFTTPCRHSLLSTYPIKLWTAKREHSKLGWSIPDFACAPTFFIKIIFNDRFLFVGSNHLVAFVWIRELWNVWAKTSNFNWLWFALQWLLASATTSLQGKDERKETNPGQF